MDGHNIVVGQRVTAEKSEQAKQLRREQTASKKLFWERLRANRLRGLHFRRQ